MHKEKETTNYKLKNLKRRERLIQKTKKSRHNSEVFSYVNVCICVKIKDYRGKYVTFSN